MNKRLSALAVTGLIIIFLINFVSAIEVNKISENLETNNKEITSLKQELNNKLSLIDNKLDKFMTEQEMTNLLTAHLQKTNEIMNNFRGLLSISIALLLLATLGLGYSIYFYFKGQGRL